MHPIPSIAYEVELVMASSEISLQFAHPSKRTCAGLSHTRAFGSFLASLPHPRVCSFQAPQSLALSQSVWPKRFGEPGLFPAPKLTGLYREPSVSTSGESVNPSEAAL
jgi:hypothetical protein